MDATDPAAVDEMAGAVAEAFGGLDVLVNNVGGLIRRSPIADMDYDLWHTVMATNLDSTFLVTHAVRPLLRLTDGRIQPVEKVRTTGRALTRLVELAGDACPGRSVSVTVHHLADEVGAHRLAARLEERLDGRLVADVAVRPIGVVAAVHLGPGAIAVSLSPVVTPGS